MRFKNRACWAACGLMILVFSAAFFPVYLFMKTPVPPVASFEETRDVFRRSDAELLDRHGQVLHELRVDMEGRRLDWTALGNISPVLVKAVLYAEDRRFYSHKGADWMALGSASIRNVLSEYKRGASTVTMQLAALLKKELRAGRGKKDIALKIRQIKMAIAIEKKWKKEEILEAYFNLVSFRGELQGVTAASWGLFGKEPSGLNQNESVILASLIRSPNAPVPEVIRRARSLAKALGFRAGKEEIGELAGQSLTGAYMIKRPVELAFNAALLLLSKDRRRVVSTIDGSLQRFSAETLDQYVNILSPQNVSDGAVLVVHNRTGEVLAYVANRGALSPARFVDGIRAKRQAGSTLKPFLYAAAFEKKILTPASLLSDEPLDIPTSRGIYSPNNYDKQFNGIVTARTALASSLNIPAVRTAMLAGNDLFVKVLGSLGIEELKEGDFYGPAIALGTAEVSLWELVGAYRSLAIGGLWGQLRMTSAGDENPSKKRRIFSKETTFLVSDILSDREARSYTFGFQNPLATRFWSAVKTGTSKDMRDNWCVGYSKDYTVGVWVGNFNNAPMWNVSGVSGAAPVWLDIMHYLHKGSLPLPPVPPEGVVSQRITDRDEHSLRREWFIRGTEPKEGNQVWAEAAYTMREPKIAYPSEGMIIAIDPDIPSEQQKVFFETNSALPKTKWLLNGSFLGSSEMIIWAPVRGDYELVLTDENDRLLDKISFQVR